MLPMKCDRNGQAAPEGGDDCGTYVCCFLARGRYARMIVQRRHRIRVQADGDAFSEYDRSARLLLRKLGTYSTCQQQQNEVTAGLSGSVERRKDADAWRRSFKVIDGLKLSVRFLGREEGERPLQPAAFTAFVHQQH